MRVLRPVEKTDLENIYTLAMESGVGLTTLVKDKNVLATHIETSMDAFSKVVIKPQNENYFFVLEDTNSRQVVGTSAINAAVGFHSPFYSYRLSNVTRVCQQLNIRTEYNLLNVVNDFHGKTELCTLFLDPHHRQYGSGHLLSRGRFLFIAQFAERFSETIFADLRGVSDEQGISPFWESLGRNFFQMDFSEADLLTITTDKQFIADLLPRNPIYTVLLSESAQQVIGKPHQSTVPAMKLLEQEGFSYQRYVDIFDGGPTVQAELPHIKTVMTSNVARVEKIDSKIESPLYLISNTRLAFRACLGQLIELKTNEVSLTQETADLLQVQQGDTVRYALFS